MKSFRSVISCSVRGRTEDWMSSNQWNSWHRGGERERDGDGGKKCLVFNEFIY